MTAATGTPMTNTARRRIGRPLQYLALLGYVVFLGFPMVFLLSSALKTERDLRSPDPTLLPRELTWQNFVGVLEQQNLVGAALNSLFVALMTTVIVTLLALPAAYAIARYRTRLRTVAIGWILLSQVFPFILIVIPLFLVLKQLNLLNNLFGLVLIYTVWALPFALWMLRGFIAGIPDELEEAGAVDGAGRLQVLQRIVLPLLAPGLVATSLFTFISSWNEFFFALVIIQDESRETLPLRLARFIGAEGQIQLGQLAAGSLLATIPSLVFFAIIQRRLTSGLLSGAVKG